MKRNVGAVWKLPAKGQIKPKADLRTVESSKKQTKKFFFCREKQNKNLLVFWENLQHANLFMVLADL